jgi:hypothetical protein
MTSSYDETQQLRQEAEQLRLFLRSIDEDTKKLLRKIKRIPPDCRKISALAANKGFIFSHTCLEKSLSTDDLGRPQLRVPGYGWGDIHDQVLGLD